MTAPIDTKNRLTELARLYFGDDKLEVDAEFYTPAYGMTLREMLENPELGERAVFDYWGFKITGGYE